MASGGEDRAQQVGAMIDESEYKEDHHEERRLFEGMQELLTVRRGGGVLWRVPWGGGGHSGGHGGRRPRLGLSLPSVCAAGARKVCSVGTLDMTIACPWGN